MQSKKEELEKLRSRWNWDSKEATQNKISFILSKSQQDYIKVYGKADGVGLSRYQAELLESEADIGTHNQIARRERNRVRRVVLNAFKEFPSDTVTGLIAAQVLQEVTGASHEVTIEDIDTVANIEYYEETPTGPIDLPDEDLDDPAHPAALYFPEPLEELTRL